MRHSGLLGLRNRGFELPIRGFVLLALLHVALVSPLDVRVGVNAAQLDRRPDEHMQSQLLQSVARYSDMVVDDKEWRRRNLLQVDTKKRGLRPKEATFDHGLDKAKSVEERIRELEQEKEEIAKVLHKIKDPEDRKQRSQTAVKDKARQLEPKPSQIKQTPSREQSRKSVSNHTAVNVKFRELENPQVKPNPSREQSKKPVSNHTAVKFRELDSPQVKPNPTRKKSRELDTNQTAVSGKSRQVDPPQVKQISSRKEIREPGPEKKQIQNQTRVREKTSEPSPEVQEDDIDARRSVPVRKSNDGHNAQQLPQVSQKSTTKKKSRDPTPEELKVMEELGNPEPYVLGPKIEDWDEQRGAWLKANPSMKSNPDGKPRVLIVTGSQPWPCRSPEGDFFHVRSLKLKMDYARMHGYEIYYNLVNMDPLFGSYWVKLPIVRKIMLTHPEIEWIFWVDSDAVFTDMIFEPPFEDYDRDGHNMVMWSWKDGYYKQKSWISVNVGVFILRNCQWSLDLLDKWSPMGPDGLVRNAYGKMLTDYLPDRLENYPADDQSALIYLMLTDETVMDKVRLVENEYVISGWWVEFVNTYETAMETSYPGIGGKRWPWITHFTGCSPCNGGGNEQFGAYEVCMANFTRAYSFADNQVLAYMGYQHENLGSREVVRIRNETSRPIDIVGANPWKERIAQLSAQA